MKQHASRRRPHTRERKERPRSFSRSALVAWDSARSVPIDTVPRTHATTWRMRLSRAFTAVFASPRWISLIVLAVIGTAMYLIGYQNTFVITEVQVRGTVALSKDTVVRASGIQNQLLFWVDAERASDKVASLPSVLTATVTISWPNQASISVAERAPVIAWDQAGQRFWVDVYGTLMPARQQSSALLVVLSQEREPLATGGTVPQDVLAGALQLKRLRPNIASLYYDRANGLSYRDGRNWQAYFGSGADMNQKLVIYEALVQDLMARNLQPEYISVITKEKPFYRLSNPAG